MGTAILLKGRSLFRHAENFLTVVTLLLIFIFPFSDMLARFVGQTGIRGSSEFLYHLIIIFTLLGALLASREGSHISLAAIDHVIPEHVRKWTSLFRDTVAASVIFSLAFSAISFVFNVWSPTDRLAGILPMQVIMSVFPLGFFAMGVRAAIQPSVIRTIIALLVSLATPIVLSYCPVEFLTPVFYALLCLLFVATILGAPIFVVLGGVTALLFYKVDMEMGMGVTSLLPFLTVMDSPVIINEAYTVLTSPIFPTIPLFTMAGFILSEGKAGERLVAFFQAVFAPFPGGMAIMAVVVCAFFTTFTGASGVTILALGGLLHFALTKHGYDDRFTTGYLTASGSIGLLFPPSLPIILYGVQAQVNIKHLFAGGIFPGILMVVALAAYAMIHEHRRGTKRAKRPPFVWREVFTSFRGAAWEVALPVLIIVLFFNGITTIVETGAVAIFYLLVTSLFIHRDIALSDLPRILLKAAPIAGSVLIILAMAKGLSYYIVDAEIPSALVLWCQEHIHSKWTFLLLLNVALLLTGFFMDIFSAIIVVVPLILPISEVFGIDPVHLGIIFLANLELGYLTPPVGLNLFLAALRFERPLVSIYRSVLPFLAIMIVTVLLITYVPFITEIGLKLFAGK